MIKYNTFQFKELDVPDHWVAFPNFGELISTNQVYTDFIPGLDIHLNPEECYQISFDQSTTNTGIFIKNYRNTEAYMIEVHRSKGQNAGDYIYNLELLIHEMFEGCQVSHLIYERPIKTESYRSAQALFQLEGMIMTLHLRYPEFRAAKTDCIENASWRAAVILPELGDRYTRKEKSKVSVERIWEWTRAYVSSLSNDEDIYEAVGVMMGWFFKSFDPLGRPYVRGDRTTRTVGALVLPGLPVAEVVPMLKAQGIEPKWAVQNPDYSIYENLCAGINPYDVMCVEFSDPYSMLCICIESNIKWGEFGTMTVILSDAACVDERLKEMASGSFHFVI